MAVQTTALFGLTSHAYHLQAFKAGFSCIENVNYILGGKCYWECQKYIRRLNLLKLNKSPPVDEACFKRFDSSGELIVSSLVTSPKASAYMVVVQERPGHKAYPETIF